MNFPKNVDLTNPFQKGVALILAAVAAMGVYMLMPPLIVFLKNLWLVAIYGVPLAFLIYNYDIVWHWFKKLSWEMTKFSISKDRPGYLYKFHEYCINKIQEMTATVRNVKAIKAECLQKITATKSEVEVYKKEGVQYLNVGKQTLAAAAGTKAKLKEGLLDKLVPRYELLDKQDKDMTEILELRRHEAEEMKFAIDAKIEEYDTLKEIDKAIKAAGASMDQTTDQYKAYQESLKQMNKQMNQYTANIEMFDSTMKPILEKASVDKSINEAEGLKFIEDYKANRYVPEFKLLAAPVPEVVKLKK